MPLPAIAGTWNRRAIDTPKKEWVGERRGRLLPLGALCAELRVEVEVCGVPGEGGSERVRG